MVARRERERERKGAAGLTLCDFSQRSTLFTEIDDQPYPTSLRALDALLDPIDQIGSARADVRTEHVAAVAFVVHAQGELLGRVREVGRVAKDVDGEAADGGQERLEVGSGDEFGVHPAGFWQGHTVRVVIT